MFFMLFFFDCLIFEIVWFVYILLLPLPTVLTPIKNQTLLCLFLLLLGLSTVVYGFEFEFEI